MTQKRILPLGIVLDEQSNILMLHRIDRSVREPVKGGLEGDESPEQAIKRELFEETGISDIIGIQKVFENTKLIIDHQGTELEFERIVYCIRILGIKPKIFINHITEGGTDHDNYGRFSIQKLDSLEIEHRDFLSDVLRNLSL